MTATQELASVLMGEDVIDYVIRARERGVRWDKIAANIAERTGGRVQITTRSLQLWTQDQRTEQAAAAPPPEHPDDAAIRSVTEWVAEQRAMAAR